MKIKIMNLLIIKLEEYELVLKEKIADRIFFSNKNVNK